jgi:hypothetical protein
MKCDRFLHNLHFLHFTDNNTKIDRHADNYDQLWKIWAMFDTLNDAYEKYYNPSEHLAVDEIIVKCNCLPSIIRIIKSRRMRQAGHVARMGRRGMHIGFWWEGREERDHYEDLDVGGRII